MYTCFIVQEIGVTEKNNTLVVSRELYKEIFYHEGEPYVSQFLHQVCEAILSHVSIFTGSTVFYNNYFQTHSNVRTQVLKEMRKGVAPKLDAGKYGHYEVNKHAYGRQENYVLTFYEDGTVHCLDGFFYDDERHADVNSVGIFEVCISTIQSIFFDRDKLCQFVRFLIQS